MTKQERHEADPQIIELRERGLTMENISEIVGRSLSWVQKICKENGLDGIRVRNEWTEERRETARRKAIQNGLARLKPEEDIKSKCEQIGYEYVGGYEGTEGLIKIKCLKCGYVFDRAWQCVRKVARGEQKGIVCQGCIEARRSEAKEKKKAKLSEQRIQKAKEKEKAFWNQTFQQKKISFCIECGNPIWNGNKYCSHECMTAYNNKQGKDRRLRQIKTVNHTYIDIKKLYVRDKGICHLCGGICDFEDSCTREDGTFIAGNNYPSIDHVIPLRMGGQHTWENVKLAHRLCNSQKGDLGARFNPSLSNFVTESQ